MKASTSRYRQLITLIAFSAFFSLFFFFFPPAFSSYSRHGTSTERVLHPIPALIREAKLAHSYAQGNKSSTLRQAYERYKETHNRYPPKGYDVWFEKAQEKGVCNLDSFEELYESLKVWWALEPEEIRSRTEQLANVSALGRVAIRKGKVLSVLEMVARKIKPGMKTENQARDGFEEMVKEVVKMGVKLPDADFFINQLDEPRIIIPYELRTSLEELAQDGQVRTSVRENTTFYDLNGAESKVNPFSVIRQSCPPDSLARTTSISKSPGSSPHVSQSHTSSFTTSLGHFLTSPKTEREWCDQPDVQDLHAVFVRPLSFAWSEQLFPVFSNSKIKGFNDILVPSWYVWGGWTPYVPQDDMVWKYKADNLYWRGSNTGGKSFGLNWKGWMRSRFVALLNRPLEWEEEDTVLLATATGSLITTTLPSYYLNLGLADVAFSTTDAHGDPESLQSQRDDPSMRFTGKVPFKSNYGSKAIMDLDGTAYSGRWTTLMKSESAIFKSRLYVEAMDETLVPWYHYIPVSIRYSEIYSLLGYFFGPRRVLSTYLRDFPSKGHRKLVKDTMEAVPHENELKNVAERGTAWAQKCARKEDSVSFVHLLVLEWARLMSDDRDLMTFVLEDLNDFEEER